MDSCIENTFLGWVSFVLFVQAVRCIYPRLIIILKCSYCPLQIMPFVSSRPKLLRSLKRRGWLQKEKVDALVYKLMFSSVHKKKNKNTHTQKKPPQNNNLYREILYNITTTPDCTSVDPKDSCSLGKQRERGNALGRIPVLRMLLNAHPFLCSLQL